MNERFDVSVVICTYNRCDLLPPALESIVEQSAAGVGYEVIVVDNNSTDGTRQVVEAMIARGHANLRYVFEGEQGLSHARNAGVRAARAPVVAFTDDDVRAAPEWVASIKRAFDEHPEAAYVGGKVLPRWESGPPRWLTPADHWAPLALLDRGDESFYTNAENPICLVGANLSFRREVFTRVGLFSTDFKVIGVSSADDHELQLRVWKAGEQGLYVPGIFVVADVQADRLTKAYHRKWHTGHGTSSAMMRLYEIIGPDGRLLKEPSEAVTLFGASAPVYREVLVEAERWLSATAQRREHLAFRHENQVREMTSYIRHRYRQNAAERKHSLLAEIAGFAKALLRKKTGVARAGESKKA